MADSCEPRPPETPGYKQRYFGWSQSTFGGHLACTSIATIMACAMADDQQISKYDLADEDKLGFLTEFGCGLWKENVRGLKDESTASVTKKHCFFAQGNNYHNESYQGYWGDVLKTGGLISLPAMVSVIRSEHHKHGSVGAVITDNVVSFAVGITVRDGVKWVLFDSHAPGAKYRTIPLVDEAYVAKSIKAFAARKDTIFDCTVFWR